MWHSTGTIIGSMTMTTTTNQTKRSELLFALRSYDDGTGNLGVSIDHALADNSNVTSAEIADVLDEAIDDARVERDREAAGRPKATKTRYKIKTGPEHGSGERPWMLLPSTVTADPISVGAWCYYAAATTDPAALESALEADPDVIEYEVAGA